MKDSFLRGVTREVKEKGVKTLIDFSIKWKDGKQSPLERLKSVTVHKKGRKVYTKESAESCLKCLREVVPDFDFLHDCLLWSRII